MTIDTILHAPTGELLDMLIDAYNSSENQNKLREPEQFRFITGIGRTVFANAFSFKTLDYYNNPEVCLRTQLQWKLYTYHFIKDDNYLDLEIGIDYATAYEASFFGQTYTISEGIEPTYGPPLMLEADELSKLQKPDFFNSGLMPRAHEMFRALQELTEGKAHVFFPGWSRGPWSIATIVRGFEGVFLDSLADPENLHELLQFIVDSRISWEDQRCSFLGISPRDHSYRWKNIIYRRNHNSDMFEDEVDGKMMSPTLVREFVIPYTRQLCKYYGGIDYYHSCGDITSFLTDLYKELDICTTQHVGAWTDFKKAAEIVPQNVKLQISLHTVNDFSNGTDEYLKAKFKTIFDSANGHAVDICPDAVYSGGWDTLERTIHIRNLYQEAKMEYFHN